MEFGSSHKLISVLNAFRRRRFHHVPDPRTAGVIAQCSTPFGVEGSITACHELLIDVHVTGARIKVPSGRQEIEPVCYRRFICGWGVSGWVTTSYVRIKHLVLLPWVASHYLVSSFGSQARILRRRAGIRDGCRPCDSNYAMGRRLSFPVCAVMRRVGYRDPADARFTERNEENIIFGL